MPILEHTFGTNPRLDWQVYLAAALNKLGGMLRFWPDDLRYHRGAVHWVLHPQAIRVWLKPSRFARPWQISSKRGRVSRDEEGKAYLAMALAKLGGQMTLIADDLRFPAGDVGYLMQRKGEAFEVRLSTEKGKVAVIGPVGAGAPSILTVGTTTG